MRDKMEENDNIEAMKAEMDTMREALDRYKKENEKFRTQRDEYKAQAESGEVNEKFRTKALSAEAKLRLAALGVKDTDRLAKYIDFSKVEIDDEDNISGLDEQIDGLKTDFAEVFDHKRRVGGKADAAANNPAATPKTTTERQIESIFGRK